VAWRATSGDGDGASPQALGDVLDTILSRAAIPVS
jgi:hypothetical protein